MNSSATASSSSSSGGQDMGAQSGYAEHIHWCPHVESNVQYLDVSATDGALDPNDTICTRCPNKQENWLCLQCHTLFCGRFANGHMLTHSESTGHCVAAGLSDLSFWCYACESYLYHRTIPKLYAVYAALHWMKFKEAPVDPPLPSAQPGRSRVVGGRTGVASLFPTDDEELGGSSSFSSIVQLSQEELDREVKQREEEHKQTTSSTGSSSSDSASAASSLSAQSSSSAQSQAQSHSATGSSSSSTQSGSKNVPTTSSSRKLTLRSAAQQRLASYAAAVASSASSVVSYAAAATSVLASSIPLPLPVLPAMRPTTWISHLFPSSNPLASATNRPCSIAGLTKEQMNDPFINRLLGVIYGSALGDAHGLATEFLNRRQVEHLYGERFEPMSGVGVIPFPHVKKTFHSEHWQHGDWTDDTDQMILIMEAILECFDTEPGHAEKEKAATKHIAKGGLGEPAQSSGDSALPMTSATPSQVGEKHEELPSSSSDPALIDPLLFAAKLRQWAQHGFAELGDLGGQGLGALTRQVLGNRSFLSNPHAAAIAVWQLTGCNNAANGSLMRTAIVGLFDSHNLETVIQNTINIATTTHADPRCTASCLIITLLIAMVMEGVDISTNASVESLISNAVTIALERVSLSEEHRAELLRYVYEYRSLAQLELDDPRAIGYVFKCLASGLYGLRSAVYYQQLQRQQQESNSSSGASQQQQSSYNLRHRHSRTATLTHSFIITLTSLIRQGGDSDTNGILCGGMMGLVVGYNQLPTAWLNHLPHKRWLDRKVARFVKLAERRRKEAATVANMKAESAKQQQ